MLLLKPSLLVVEPDTRLRLALSIVFCETGCRVRMAADGFSALAEIQHELPDILVADLDMPDLDMSEMAGHDLLSVVSSLFPSIKVIAVGAEAGGDHVPPGVAADAFHGKGASPHNLIALVRLMAGEVRSARQWKVARGYDAVRLRPSSSRTETARQESVSRPLTRMALVS